MPCVTRRSLMFGVAARLAAKSRAPATAGSLGGFAGLRFQRNIDGYLKRFDTDRFVRMIEIKTYRECFWLGEQPGKWLEAAIESGDAGRARQAQTVLGRLSQAQDADGYCGIADLAVRTARHPMRGMDPHELYFTLQGFITAGALPQATRLADFSGQVLDWCHWAVASLNRWSASDNFSRLDQAAVGKIHLKQLQPNVHANTLHMNMLCFLRMGYRAKVQGAWRDIMANCRYASVAEGYKNSGKLPDTGSVVETCASMSWLYRNQALFKLTADPKCADAMERLLWNHCFAAQRADGESFRYRSGDGIYVNQFIKSTIRFPQATLRQQTTYPDGDRIAIEVDPRTPPFTLFMRLPQGCGNPSVTVNGAQQSGAQPGSRAATDREWKRGDRVKLCLPRQTRWLSQDLQVALERGPAVDLGEGRIGQPISRDIRQTDAPRAQLGPFFEGGAVRVRPFANLGHRWHNDEDKRQHLQISRVIRTGTRMPFGFPVRKEFT